MTARWQGNNGSLNKAFSGLNLISIFSSDFLELSEFYTKNRHDICILWISVTLMQDFSLEVILEETRKRCTCAHNNMVLRMN